MKVVILAGGMGTRLSEVTDLRPKPMVEIGNKPILWHIMKLYSFYGFNDFIICCGYKGSFIKEYFHHYYMHHSDITINLQDNSVDYHGSKAEPWKITLVETGLNTMTGGRIKRIEKFIDNETFMLTYGDGVSNVNIKELLEFHKNNKKMATVTAVKPSGRFGALEIENNDVRSFYEKPQGDGAWINGGFFVLEPGIFNYIENQNDTIWERSPMEKLAFENQLCAYRHEGFWKPMDTLRDKTDLESLWNSNKADWKVWDD